VRRQARRDLLIPGGILAAVGSAAALNISFAAPFFNFLAVLAALCAAGALVLLLFGIRPSWLGIPLGVLGIGAWLMACLWIVMLAAFDGNSPFEVALGDGLLCRRTVYGSVASDSGQDLAIYRRMLFIDRRLYVERHSDVYPNGPHPAPARLRDAVARCRAQAGVMASSERSGRSYSTGLPFSV
jgi:hypothetical protein